MAIFKYTVANKEGKKLNGTVEAPNEETARMELNNLGFSIFALEETKELPKEDKDYTKFVFEAIDKNMKLISGSISAKTEEDASTKLNKEYSLTVTSIWKEGASEKEIETAKQKGSQMLQKTALQQEEIHEKNLQEEKDEAFLKAKIETILKQVFDLLKTFDKELDQDEKTSINKQIDKLLRIKQSKNTAYILATAEELLKYIQSQEKQLKDRGEEQKRIDLHMQTKKLLDELNKTQGPKTLAEDIVGKINTLEKGYMGGTENKNPIMRFFTNVLEKIKKYFETPPAILMIKNQIKTYNKQLFEFIKLYFKEPTAEYKEKVKNAIKAVWNARKKAKHTLKYIKQLEKGKIKESQEENHIMLSFIDELNSLTGWLLAFYLIYYLVSLYLTTKNFGIPSIPKGFFIYKSAVFKYILSILFLLHGATALKVNFFRKSRLASAIIVPIFLICSILVILNF